MAVDGAVVGSGRVPEQHQRDLPLGDGGFDFLLAGRGADADARVVARGRTGGLRGGRRRACRSPWCVGACGGCATAGLAGALGWRRRGGAEWPGRSPSRLRRRGSSRWPGPIFLRAGGRRFRRCRRRRGLWRCPWSGLRRPGPTRGRRGSRRSRRSRRTAGRRRSEPSEEADEPPLELEWWPNATNQVAAASTSTTNAIWYGREICCIATLFGSSRTKVERWQQPWTRPPRREWA